MNKWHKFEGNKNDLKLDHIRSWKSFKKILLVQSNHVDLFLKFENVYPIHFSFYS